ncbi:MAG: T9SS type A sorting domain-containing protein [Chlorobi bacterium]|nr:T9SS type A sorting domain-containing protein [Chlorobiota bacterium]
MRGTWKIIICFVSLGILAISFCRDLYSQSATGIPQSLLIDYNSGDVYCSTTLGGMLKSTNNGATWMRVQSGLDTMRVQFAHVIVQDPFDERHLLAGFSASGGSSILVETTNAGLDWRRRGSPGDWYWIDDVTFPESDPGYAWVAGSNGVWKVELQSNRWTDRTPPGETSCTNVRVDASNPDIVWCACEFTYASFLQGRVYRSADGGQGWTRVLDSLPVTVRKIFLDPRDQGSAFVVDRFVRETSDTGATWPGTYYPDGLTVITGADFDRKSSTWFIGDLNDSLYTSTDGGESWKALPLPVGGFYTDIVISPLDPCRVYVVRNDGLFQTSDCGRSWVENPFDIVTSVVGRKPAVKFEIRRPYPNPVKAGETITIAFGNVPPAEMKYPAMVAVRDPLGRKVWEGTSGKYLGENSTLAIPTSALGPGVYYYFISIGGKYAQGRFVVVK